MTIEFVNNERPTVGVEMELHLVDAESGELASVANEVLTELAEPHGDEHPKAKHELFQCTVEVITGVCETPGQAAEDLHATIDEVRRVAAPHGATLASSGTHPFAIAEDQLVSPDPRYHQLIEAMQWAAKRLLICGMHVHVGVPSGKHAIDVINEVTRHLPLFLGLSTSSPYFEGNDSGMMSARSLVFESLPTAGLPPMISDWSDFESFMATLIDTGCIQTVREVWWDVRPHPGFGTVELRMCDAMPTVDESVAVAGLAQTLVTWILERIDDRTLEAPPTEWSVKQNRWLAARYGLDAELIVEYPHDEPGRRRSHPGSAVGTPDATASAIGGRDVERRNARDLLDRLVDTLRPTAARLGTGAQLDRVLEIAEHGTGSQRQRAVHAATGSLRDVALHLVEEFSADRPLPATPAR